MIIVAVATTAMMTGGRGHSVGDDHGDGCCYDGDGDDDDDGGAVIMVGGGGGL